MTTYEITATVRADISADYERYMRERHIPDLLATGAFHAASFATAGPGRYRIRYEARDRTALDRYLDEHAPRLRAEFDAHFADGVTLAREIWESIALWPTPRAG